MPAKRKQSVKFSQLDLLDGWHVCPECGDPCDCQGRSCLHCREAELRRDAIDENYFMASLEDPEE